MPTFDSTKSLYRATPTTNSTNFCLNHICSLSLITNSVQLDGVRAAQMGTTCFFAAFVYIQTSNIVDARWSMEQDEKTTTPSILVKHKIWLLHCKNPFCSWKPIEFVYNGYRFPKRGISSRSWLTNGHPEELSAKFDFTPKRSIRNSRSSR